MSEWATWIIQVVAYGIICFLLKRELNQMDTRHKTLSDQIQAVEQEARKARQEMQESLQAHIAEVERENREARKDLQEGLQIHIDAIQKEAKQSDLMMEEKLQRFMEEMPFKYTLRDDFIRTVARMENKLDKILDQLNRNSGPQ